MTSCSIRIAWGLVSISVRSEFAVRRLLINLVTVRRRAMNKTRQLFSPRTNSTHIRTWAGIVAAASVLGFTSGTIAQQPSQFVSPGSISAIESGTVINLQRSLYTAKFTCGIWDEGLQVGKTAAQLNKGLGAGPPLPPEYLTPPLLAQQLPPPYYHDFQPGSYSTALNIFNPTLRPVDVQVKISSDSLSGPIVVATKSINSLEATRIGCSDIEAILPNSFAGELVEGFFHITRFRTDLHVQAVYTYSTIAAFQEFRGGFVEAAGAGAGAGGLGLGASVDIETVKPIGIGF
ncbi:hypothetical protein Noc_A0017 (plasmid) [Nitrosococcus oceani ATCC 19707]|uniref:Uncharacterized protein n=3 Tax=Nitrosococcus oceani TaxID=1229 RepID=Q3JF66_NITOC|nr:hypothetical protein Noc_A0017 [Nitrosococcus oceani ATCC 19707]EDZ65248.1 hypothetical protein NOC27_3412 [Nitrosococcus oceani AFC27]KFI17796.1 hypothetical protein IB75_18740 [Nitrosococcus oceani C-27]